MGFEGKVKIADFGTSANVMMGVACMTKIRTPLYCASEIYECKIHDEKVDVWLLGICLHEFLVGEKPTFQGTDIKWPDNLGVSL